MEEVYNKYYIKIDTQNRITDGWSDGPHPERDTAGAICLNEQGGYQFRISSDGEENPPLYTEDCIPLYKWDGRQAQPRTAAEISADREALPLPPNAPSVSERLDALENAMLTMMGGLENV